MDHRSRPTDCNGAVCRSRPSAFSRLVASRSHPSIALPVSSLSPALSDSGPFFSGPPRSTPGALLAQRGWLPSPSEPLSFGALHRHALQGLHLYAIRRLMRHHLCRGLRDSFIPAEWPYLGASCGFSASQRLQGPVWGAWDARSGPFNAWNPPSCACIFMRSISMPLHLHAQHLHAFASPCLCISMRSSAFAVDLCDSLP